MFNTLNNLAIPPHRNTPGFMPRQARLDAPGTLHHVIVRGIEKKPIVIDDTDRRKFVERMGGLALESKTARQLRVSTLAPGPLPPEEKVMERDGPFPSGERMFV